MLAELLATPPTGNLQSTARVEEVVSAAGVRAYLMREPTIPFLSLSLHIRGGGAADPAGKEGLAFMAAGLLDEGAGPYDSQAFRAEVDDHALRLHFEADRDGVSGELRTLTANRAHAFDLLRLAMTEPRFDPEPVERVRSQILADLRRREADPDYLASRAWFAAAFPGTLMAARAAARPRASPRSRSTTAARSSPAPRPRPAGGRRGRRHHARGAGAPPGRHLRRPPGRPAAA